MPVNTKHLTLPFSSKSKSHFTNHHKNRNMDCHKIFLSLLSFIILSCLIIPSRAQNSAQDYVNAHNTARSQVGVAPVVWNTTLANCAQNYANQRIGDCALTHSNGIYGENLAKGSSSSFSGVSAVNMWVAEKQYYDYNSNSCVGGNQCLHYTQVVWHDSTQLGCARVQCSNGWYYVVCNYDGPGNWEGEWPY